MEREGKEEREGIVSPGLSPNFRNPKTATALVGCKHGCTEQAASQADVGSCPASNYCPLAVHLSSGCKSALDVYLLRSPVLC